MKKRLPVRSLIRLNWLITGIISVLVFLYLLHFKAEHHEVFYGFTTAITVGLIGYTNIGILTVLDRKYGAGTKKFRVYRYLLTYPASVLAYLGLWPVYAYLVKKSWSYTDLDLLGTFILSGILVNSIMLLLQTFVLLITDKADADLELSRLKTANAEALNLLLKQQIHPHFLFNALNTLKVLYRKDTRAGDEYIVHLANFLRASVYRHSSNVSRLEDELGFLADYVAMQKIRFGNALACTVTVPDKMRQSFFLPTFSLQPLVENAIKHNELTAEAPLKVCIYTNGDWVTISNNLQKKQLTAGDANSGLANLAERYRLCSGDEIIIKQEQKTFSVSIKLLTDEYSHYRG